MTDCKLLTIDYDSAESSLDKSNFLIDFLQKQEAVDGDIHKKLYYEKIGYLVCTERSFICHALKNAFPNKEEWRFFAALSDSEKYNEVLSKNDLLLTDSVNCSLFYQCLFDKAIEFCPKNHPNTILSLPFFELACEYKNIVRGYEMGCFANTFSEHYPDDYLVKRKIFENAVKTSPDDSNVLCDYANLLWKAFGENDQAEFFYHKVILNADLNAPTRAQKNQLANYAEYLLYMGKDEDAYKFIELARDVGRSWPSLYAECLFYEYMFYPNLHAESIVMLLELLKEQRAQHAWDLSKVLSRFSSENLSFRVGTLLSEMINGRVDCMQGIAQLKKDGLLGDYISSIH